MVDPNAIQAISPVGRKVGFFKVLSFSFLSIYIFLLLVNTIYVAIDSRSIMPVIKNLGDTFLLSSQHISDISKEIVSNNGGYIQSPDFFTGIWNYLKIKKK